MSSMFGIHNYLGFVAAIIAFQAVPGPGTLTILNATARHGIRAGIGAVMGTIIGDFVFMLSAVLGLAAVLAARPVILTGLQWMGIIYLCWFGLKLLRAPATTPKTGQASKHDHWTSFRQAFAVSMTNPKVIMFFMAFFPLFLVSSSKPYTLGLMMAHVTVISLVYQIGLVFLGNAVAVKFSKSSHARAWARRCVGLGLLGFSLKLAINRK